MQTSTSRVPKFLTKLYDMINQEPSCIVSWTSDGKAFQIKKLVVFEQRLLPKYFKHGKMKSFQRQLNYFGFRKWTKTQTNICTFNHSYFQANQPQLLLFITKKRALGAEAFPAHSGISVPRSK